MSLNIQSDSFGGGMNALGTSNMAVGSPVDQGAGNSSQTSGGSQQNDALEQVIELLVKALLKSSQGSDGQSAQGARGVDQSQGAGQGQNSDLGDMLKQLMSNVQQNGGANPSQGGAGGDTQGAQGSNGKMGTEDLMKMMLMMMMMQMMNGGKGDASGAQGGAGGIGGDGTGGGIGGANGTSGGMSGTGGTSIQDLGKSLVDIGNSLMQSAGENTLSNAIHPTQDGGGQIGSGLGKDSLKTVAQMMDNNTSTFGNAGKQQSPSIGLSTGMS